MTYLSNIDRNGACELLASACKISHEWTGLRLQSVLLLYRPASSICSARDRHFPKPPYRHTVARRPLHYGRVSLIPLAPILWHWYRGENMSERGRWAPHNWSDYASHLFRGRPYVGDGCRAWCSCLVVDAAGAYVFVEKRFLFKGVRWTRATRPARQLANTVNLKEFLVTIHQ